MTRVVVLYVLLAGALTLAGCSFFFSNGVQGVYTKTGAPLVGILTAHNEPGGKLTLGSAQKIECEGRYKEAERAGLKLFGVRIIRPIYKGKLACVDGREGHFELASGLHEHTGSVTGEIGGEAFTLKLIKPKSEECRNAECRWGLKWNEDEIFFGIRDRSMLDKVNRPSSGM